MKTLFKVCIFFLAVVLISKCANAQGHNPPQQISSSYIFTAVGGDSATWMSKLQTPSYYRRVGSFYWNVTDSNVYVWTGTQFLCKTCAAGGGLTSIRVGLIDSIAATANGGSTNGGNLYFQRVSTTQPGLLTSGDYVNFHRTYRFFKNTDSTKRDYFSFFAGNTTLSGLDNIGIGESSSSNLTSGAHNIGIGYFTNNAPTTGSDRISIGWLAGQSSNSSQSVAMGSQALRNNQSDGMTAIGWNAFSSSVTGTFGTAVGWKALTQMTSGIGNTAVGSQALERQTIANYNTAVGWLALNQNLTGPNNTAVGFGSNSGNFNGSDNTSYGYLSMDFGQGGFFNTAIGSQALAQDTVGSYNTCLGYRAMSIVLKNLHTIGIGAYCLGANVPVAIASSARSSNYSICIGDSVGTYLTSSTHYDSCIMIGRQIKVLSEADSQRTNVIIIGNGIKTDTNNVAIFGTGTQHVRLTNGGGNTSQQNAINSAESDIYYNNQIHTYTVRDDVSFKPLLNPISRQTPANLGTVSLVNNGYNILDPGGAIAGLTINFPSSPSNNDQVEIKLTTVVTTITYGNGTVVGAPTSSVSGYLKFKYLASTSSWY